MPDADLQLELAGALWHFWFVRCHLAEGLKWLGEALDRTPGKAASRAKALHGLSLFADRSGDFALAQSCAEEELELFEGLGDAAGMARALVALGSAFSSQGDLERAQELYERARSSALEAGDSRYVAIAIGNLGDLALSRHDYERALASSHEALDLNTELGDPEGRSISLSNLALASFGLGRHEGARGYAKESLAIAHDLNNPFVIAWACTVASALAAAQGRPGEAACLVGIVDRLVEIAGGRLFDAEQQLHDETRTVVREQLDAEQLAAAQAVAQAMSVAEAVDYAVRSLS